MSAAYLAVDLGAESGRVVLGRFDGGHVSLEEIHRFPNMPVRLPDGLHWDVLRILHEIKEGLAKAVRREEIEGVGVDSWGVDFGLLDRDGALVSNPYHHRDARTEGMVDEALRLASREEIYGITGIQFLPINTLYQLLAMRGSPLLEAAETLLLIPDLINYWLTGEKACEYTNATTTQLLDLKTAGWSQDLLKKLDLPSGLFAPIVSPGTELGPVLPEVAEEIGAGPPVFAVASHDTASAVVAVPAKADDFAYISSGTWSLVGVETREPRGHAGGNGGQLHQRGRLRGQYALPQERDGALAPSGVPQAVGKRRPRVLLRGAGPNRGRSAIRPAGRSRPSRVPDPGGHDGAHPTLLRGDGAGTTRTNPPRSRGASSRAWRSSTGTP